MARTGRAVAAPDNDATTLPAGSAARQSPAQFAAASPIRGIVGTWTERGSAPRPAGRPHRSAEIDSAYAAYDEHPLDEPDEWGDLASFHEAAA